MIALKGVPCACDLHDISYIVSYVHMIVVSFLISTDYSTFSNISARACLKNAFRKMCVTICGRFCPNEGVVAGYDNRIRAKYTTKWGVQIVRMIFQTHSNVMEIFGKSFSVTTVSALYCSVLTPFSHMFDLIFTPFLREIM